MKEMSFKSAVEGPGSDRWWERRRWLWWGDMCETRWTRRTVNRMRLLTAINYLTVNIILVYKDKNEKNYSN